MQTIRDTAFWAGAIIPLLFAIQYTLIAEWWRNPTGRSIMALDACIWLVLVPKVICIAWPAMPDGPADTLLWVNVLALLGVPMVIIYRMIAFEVMRRRYRREPPLFLSVAPSSGRYLGPSSDQPWET